MWPLLLVLVCLHLMSRCFYTPNTISPPPPTHTHGRMHVDGMDGGAVLPGVDNSKFIFRTPGISPGCLFYICWILCVIFMVACFLFVTLRLFPVLADP